MAESSMEEESQAPVTIEKVLEAANLVKLGMAPELRKVLKALPKDGSVNHKDAEGNAVHSRRALWIIEQAGVLSRVWRIVVVKK